MSKLMRVHLFQLYRAHFNWCSFLRAKLEASSSKSGVFRRKNPEMNDCISSTALPIEMSFVSWPKNLVSNVVRIAWKNVINIKCNATSGWWMMNNTYANVIRSIVGKINSMNTCPDTSHSRSVSCDQHSIRLLMKFYSGLFLACAFRLSR